MEKRADFSGSSVLGTVSNLVAQNDVCKHGFISHQQPLSKITVIFMQEPWTSHKVDHTGT